MFKCIPGNDEYVISLSQEIRLVSGDTTKLVEDETGKVSIRMYGVDVKVCKVWLSLIAHFEIYLTEKSYKAISSIGFLPNNVSFFRPVSSQLPIFRRPFVITHNNVIYRVVPNYTNYAVSSDGELISVDGRERINVTPVNPTNKSAKIQYPVVYVYDPDRTGYRYVPIHRLVAMAWVKNPADHFVVKCIVNHKDGNKSNYVARNLEWCSFSENSIHCFSTGLRSDSDKCRVRDFETGKVIKFHSKSQAAEFMGINKTALSDCALYLRKGKLIKDRYEFKLDTDDTPWFYQEGIEKVKPGRYKITAKFKDGVVEDFYNTNDFKVKFKLANVGSAKDLLKVARMHNPEIQFSLHDNYQSGNIQAYVQVSGKMLETRTIIEMSKLTGVSKQNIRRLIINGEQWTFSGFAFRYKKEEPWCKDFKRKDDPRNIPVKATNVTTGEEIVYDSYRKASKMLNINHRQWIKNCIEQDIAYKGWKFKLLNKENEGLMQQ